MLNQMSMNIAQGLQLISDDDDASEMSESSAKSKFHVANVL